MDTPDKKLNWQTDRLPRPTKSALEILSHARWLKNSPWYLAGGTALAIQTGHRSSIDLDFFNEKRSFNEPRLSANLNELGRWKTTAFEPGTLFGELAGTKISFIAYPSFVPKQKPRWYGSIRVLDPIDIAVMKVIAISQRGKKRDFFDFYWCANHLEPLEQIIRRLRVQYPSVAHDYHHILKALVYFNDAEDEPNPRLHFRTSWTDVKRFFTREVPLIAKRLLR